MAGRALNQQRSKPASRRQGNQPRQFSSVPWAPEQDHQHAAHVLSTWSPMLDRMTILVVDDEPSIAQLLSEVLDEAGYRVVLAADGRSALATARRERPALVLTDRMLPLLDGLEVARRLRRHPVTRHIPVVMMSSSRPDRELIGDLPFLPKPFELEELLDIVALHVRIDPCMEDWAPTPNLSP
jgi:CheY-like chemotaxis protein